MGVTRYSVATIMYNHEEKSHFLKSVFVQGLPIHLMIYDHCLRHPLLHLNLYCKRLQMSDKHLSKNKKMRYGQGPTKHTEVKSLPMSQLFWAFFTFLRQ